MTVVFWLEIYILEKIKYCNIIVIPQDCKSCGARKVNYIHQNPVKASLVNKAEDYLYSSAKNYAEEDDALFEVVCLSPRLDG